MTVIRKYMIKIIINSYKVVKVNFFRKQFEIYYMAYLNYFIICLYIYIYD